METNRAVNGVCLEVFAGVSAIVTHDLKNTLAIMNENAGLLDDLALMVGDGGVPSERVQAAAGKIAQQVTRSNSIIKNLNRFAHSGDTPTARAAIGEVLELMVALTTRKAAMRNVGVVVQCDPAHQVEMALFQLEALVYLALLKLYGVADAGSTVTVSSRRQENSLVLLFEAAVADPDLAAAFPDEKAQQLLETLGGGCRWQPEGLVLTLAAV